MEHLTAGQAERDQRRIASGLARRGLLDAERVAVVASSSGTLLLTILASLRSGVVPVVVNPLLTAGERQVVLDDAEPAAVLGDDDIAALRATEAERDLAPVPRGRPMHYTSGTTGRPKGVWSGLLDDEAAAAVVAEERDLWGFAAADHHVVCSPLHHSAPVRFAGGTLLAGGSVTVLDRFDVGMFRRSVTRGDGPTTAFMVPAHFQRLFAGGGADLTRFRLVAHAGAPCPVPLKRTAIECFPPGSVFEFYGSTEGQFTACPAAAWLEHPGTVGRARPGRSLAVDVDGTVWCRVPSHARFSYWRNPEATAAAWRDDAFTVRDHGRLDDDGYLYLDGRRTDLIITGGVNVYPAEVESILTECRGVHEVAVYGMVDELWGQRVCAAIVGPATDAAVDAHAREHLAPYKRPKQLVHLPELPRTATGKVLRRVLAGEEELG